jgi:hypothetical protein
MWKKLIDLVRDVFELRFQIKGHEKRLDDFGRFSREMTAAFNKLSERVLKLEIQLENQKEQQAAERENFRLQLENLMLRLQRGLPPGEASE